MTISAVSKIGPKGQIVLKKKLREGLGLKEGQVVEERLTPEGILVTPVDAEKLMKSLEETAAKVSAKWPKGLTSVEAVRQERRY